MKTLIQRIASKYLHVLLPVTFLLLLLSSTHGYGQAEFITLWKTTQPNEKITIPTGDLPDGTSYSYQVSWAKGEPADGTTYAGDAEHTYTTAGTYEVTITGTFPRIYFNEESDVDKILEVKQWGTQVWTSMAGAFEGCGELKITATDQPDLSICEDMSHMFERTGANFNESNSINTWNVSKVKNMSKLFAHSYFNQDISGWDVSAVENMSGMFIESDFNAAIGNWNVHNVKDMSEMFSTTYGFNQDISSWNVHSVKDMNSMFAGAVVFSQNISQWNVSNVEDMSAMFSGSVFEGNVSGWNVSKVKNMSGIFEYNPSFNGDISEWDVSSVTDMSKMFQDASAFNQDISRWNVSNVKNMSGMFSGAEAFNESLNGWNVANVNDMSEMFRSSVFSGDLSGWKVGSVKNMSGMFKGAVFNGNISQWNVSAVTHMKEMFDKTWRKASAFSGDISGWNVSGVTDMSGMFRGSAFNGDLSGWKVGSVKNMKEMFREATAFNGDISGWNVSGVTDMSGMFQGSAFNGNLSRWKVGAVQSMREMFKGASAFSGDINEWDVSSVTDMTGMFNEASTFNSRLSGWKVVSVKKMDKMFTGASAFSLANYTSLLIEWAKLGVQSGVQFGDPLLDYCSSSEAVAAVETLTTAKSWSFKNKRDCAKPIEPTGITVTPEELNLKVGETGTLTATVVPSNAPDKSVEWTWNSREWVATVDENGRVTAKSGGTTFLTVRSKAKKSVYAKVKVTVTAPVVKVTDVSIARTGSTMTKGQVTQLYALISPTHATNQKVTWESSDRAIATVDATSGVVTAVSEGTTHITVTTEDGNHQDYLDVKVIKDDGGDPSLIVPVKAVAIDEGKTWDLVLGAWEKLTLTFTPSDASNRAVTWESSDDNIASVSKTGVVTGVAEGIATVTVTTKDGGHTDDITVRIHDPYSVTNKAVESIAFVEEKITLGIKGTWHLMPIITPSDAANLAIKWTSSNDAIATVVEGLVTGVSAGEATITVTTEDGDHTASVVVEVAGDIAVSSVAIDQAKNGGNLELAVREMKPLILTFSPSNATNQKVTWESKDEFIARVTVRGRVYGIAEGSTQVTVTTEDGSHTDVITVKVSPAPEVEIQSLAFDVKEIELRVSETYELIAEITPKNGNQALKWTSSNVNIADVASGLGKYGYITTHAEGTATITVKTADDRLTASVVVKVTPASTNNNPLPGGSFEKVQRVCEGSHLTHLTKQITLGTSMQPHTIKWYASSDDADQTALPANTKVADNTTYYYSQVVNGKLGTHLRVKVAFIKKKIQGKVYQEFCPGATVGSLKIEKGEQGVGFYLSSRPNSAPLRFDEKLAGSSYGRTTTYYAFRRKCSQLAVYQAEALAIRVRILEGDKAADANFYYGTNPDALSTTYAQSDPNPSPQIDLYGGTFSAEPKTIALNAKTGLVSLSSSKVGDYIITYTTAGKCPAHKAVQFTITPPAPLSLAYPVEKDVLRLSPVPTTGKLHIHLAHKLRGGIVYRLSTLLGNIVWERTAEKAREVWEQSMDLSDLPQGIYMLEIITKEQHWTRKVVKE